ncbi:MAG: Flp family type IVb pilin [Sphingopyxis sp.]
MLRCRRGATAVEYALLISLLSISGWTAFDWVGSKIAGSMNNAAAAMPGSGSTPDDDDD